MYNLILNYVKRTTRHSALYTTPVFSWAVSSLIPALLGQQPIQRSVHMQGSLMQTDQNFSLYKLCFYSTSVSHSHRQTLQTPFSSSKALQHSNCRSLFHQYGLCPIPIPQFLCKTSYEIFLILSPHVCSLSLHDVWFLITSTLQVHQFSCGFTSQDPCHLIYHCVFTSHCIRDALSVCPISTLARGSLTATLTYHSITGSLAVCFIGPSHYTLLLESLLFTLSSVSLPVLSMLSHITYHIYYLY